MLLYTLLGLGKLYDKQKKKGQGLVQHPDYAYGKGCNCDNILKFRVECPACHEKGQDPDQVTVEIMWDTQVAVIDCHTCGQELARITLKNVLEIKDYWDTHDPNKEPHHHDHDDRHKHV